MEYYSLLKKERKKEIKAPLKWLHWIYCKSSSKSYDKAAIENTKQYQPMATLNNELPVGNEI